jgi:hypothetical protein
MTSTIPRRTSGLVLVCLLLLSVTTTGCNIFSWTHDEGGSSDSETLVQDARDALLDQKYAEALAYAKKGIENDPAPMQYPELRWIGASAALSDAGVNLSQILNALTDQGINPKAAPETAPRIAEAYQILNLSTEELLALASSCPLAVEWLGQVLDALANGDITPQDVIGLQFDIELGFGISSLMTSFLTVIDEDNDLSNGFVQNPDLQIWVGDNGEYAFLDSLGQPVDPAPYVCPAGAHSVWPLLCDALVGLNEAYATAILPDTWQVLDCTNGTIPPLLQAPNEDYIIGQVLRFVHEGLRLLTQTVTCP